MVTASFLFSFVFYSGVCTDIMDCGGYIPQPRRAPLTDVDFRSIANETWHTAVSFPIDDSHSRDATTVSTEDPSTIQSDTVLDDSHSCDATANTEDPSVIRSDTVLDARVDIVAHEDGIAAETLSLEDTGFQRTFFTEARNKCGTFATMVISYTQSAITDMKSPPEATVFLNTRIRPGIFGGESVFEVSVITDGTNRTPEAVIAVVEQGASNHHCSPPVIAWVGSTRATHHLEDAGRALLADIHKQYMEAIKGYMEEVVNFVRSMDVDTDSVSERELTAEEKRALVDKQLRESSTIWDSPQVKEKTGTTWVNIIKHYQELYAKVFHEHASTREDLSRFSVVFAVDFYDGNIIRSVPCPPPILHKVAVPRGDDVGDHLEGKDMDRMFGDEIPNIRFRAINYYQYMADTDDEEHVYPYLQSATVLYQAPDSSYIRFPNISVGISVESEEWPSVETTVPWEDLAKSIGILTSDGTLFSDKDIASQLGHTVSSAACLNVASTAKCPHDEWCSKFQAWPICKMHTTVLYPSEDMDAADPKVILQEVMGDAEEKKPEDKNPSNFPSGTSLSITPEHSLLTVNLIERIACAHTNPERVRQRMTLVAQERLDGPMLHAQTPF